MKTIINWKNIGYVFLYLISAWTFWGSNVEMEGAYMDFFMAHVCLFGACLLAKNRRTRSFLLKTFVWYALATNCCWLFLPESMALAAGLFFLFVMEYAHIKRLDFDRLFRLFGAEETEKKKENDVPNENEVWEFPDNLDSYAREVLWFAFCLVMIWITFYV